MKDNLKDVGIWGQRHYQYLKENKPSVSIDALIISQGVSEKQYI